MAAQIEDAGKDLLNPGLNGEQILALAERRMNAYAARDMAYEVYAGYYFGRQRGLGAPAKAMSSQGRPLLRDVDQIAMGEGEYRSQRLAPVVDDYQALLGRMPRSRAEPPDPAQAGLDRGEKLTKFLVSTHEISRMERQQADMGWQLPCLGDSMYLLDVAKVDKSWRVVWNVVDPRIAYPAFKSGHQRFDILDVILREYWDPYEAQAKFGSEVITDLEQDRVAITIYISAHQRTAVVGGKRHAQVVRDSRWEMPFCPAVWVFNKVNGEMAQSDIAQSLTQQDAMDFLTQLFLDGAVLSTYSIPVIKGTNSLGSEGIVHGPGAPPLTVAPDGDFKFVNSQTDLSSIKFGIDSMQAEILAATGSSEMRQTGQLHSSIQTGRAMHAAQGPQATRVELRQQELGAAIQITNAMTLEMQEKAPHLGSQEFEIFGRLRGKSFRETFKPSVDIDGWYRNTVHWEPVTGMNLQQKAAIAAEVKAAQLVDTERAMELMGEDDPRGMVERVEQDVLRQATLEARVQGMMQPQGAPGGAPGGGGPPPGNSPGGQGAQPSPTRIARPYGLGAQQPQLPTGVPQGVSREAVEKALELVAGKLKGTVFLVGELATQGQGQHIEALISDFKDFGRVAPVLRLLDPKASIKAVGEDKMPEMAVRVA